MAAPWQTSGNVKSQEYYLGRGAQKDGKMRVPAHDANLAKVLGKNGASVNQQLTDWLKGWDTSNLEPGDDPMRTETLDIIVKLREKDFTAAQKLFTELMQKKVNRVLREERRGLLNEDVNDKCAFCGEPDAPGVIKRNITNDRGRVYQAYVCSACWKEREAEIQNEAVSSGRPALSVPDRHQLKIAYDTLKLHDAAVGVMGGPSKEEAREIIKRLTGKTVTESVITEAKVECLECGKKWTTSVSAGSSPKCSKCGSTDVELAEAFSISHGDPRTGYTKKALIREPGAPIGQSAPMHLNCICGQKVYIQLSLQSKENVCEKCGRVWDPKGYLISEATKYHMCPDCEKSFSDDQLVDGKLPEHTFNGKPCENSGGLAEGMEWSGKPEAEGGETTLKSRIEKAKRKLPHGVEDDDEKHLKEDDKDFAGKDYKAKDGKTYTGKKAEHMRAQDNGTIYARGIPESFADFTLREAVETKNVTRPGSKETMYVVSVDGQEVGIITKFANTKTDTSPWKAFKLDHDVNAGKPNTILGFFYNDADKSKGFDLDQKGSAPVSYGGKQAAIDAVVKAAR